MSPFGRSDDAGHGPTGDGPDRREEAVKNLASRLTPPVGGEDDGVPDGAVSPDELLRLRQEAEDAVTHAIGLYETRFANLPALQRLRDIWKERAVQDTDPVFLMVEALSLLDARSQLQLAQVVKILRAFESLSNYTARELREVIAEASDLREVVTPLQAELAKNTGEVVSLTRGLSQFNTLVPELLQLVAQGIEIQGKNNRASRFELTAIVSVSVLFGVVVTYFLMK